MTEKNKELIQRMRSIAQASMGPDAVRVPPGIQALIDGADALEAALAQQPQGAEPVAKAGPDDVDDVWPIVNITVSEDGEVTEAKLYAPGLPPGSHDVYPVRVPYIDEHTDAWMAVANVLKEVAPGYLDGSGNGIECAVAAIRRLATPSAATGAQGLTDDGILDYAGFHGLISPRAQEREWSATFNAKVIAFARSVINRAQSAPAATAPSDGTQLAEKTVAAIDSALRGKVNDPDPLPKLHAHSVAGEPTTYGLVAGLLRERDALIAKVAKFDQRIVDIGVLAMETAAPSASAQQAVPVACYQVQINGTGEWENSAKETYDWYEARPHLGHKIRMLFAAPAPSASREAWAVSLIQAAIDIMTPEQIGQWTGVRAFLESSAPSASPAALTNDDLRAIVDSVMSDGRNYSKQCLADVVAQRVRDRMLAASPADQGEDARDAKLLRWAIQRFENADALAAFVLQHEGMCAEGLRRDIESAMSASKEGA